MLEYEECQAYFTRLLAEHRRLHALLNEARSTIAGVRGAGASQSTAQIAQALQQVRKELEHHFAVEEAGGCLDEAVSRLPRLSAEANRVEAEHPDLLRRLDRLIDLASDPEKLTKDRLSFDTELADLDQRLHAHEATENRLLQQGFCLPIDSEAESES